MEMAGSTNQGLYALITRLGGMRSRLRRPSVPSDGTAHQVPLSILMITPNAEWSLLGVSRLSHHHDRWDHARRLFEAVCILVER